MDQQRGDKGSTENDYDWEAKRAWIENCIKQHTTLLDASLRYQFSSLDAHDREDILWGAFEKLWAWRCANPQTTLDSERSWLVKVAHNSAVDLLRRRPGFISAETVADAVGKEERPIITAIRRLATELSGEEQTILLLNPAMQGGSEEIGKALGLSAGNVRTRRTRLLTQLREKLKELGFDESD